MTLGDPSLWRMHAQSLLLEENMFGDEKPAHGHTKILTDSARKRNGKEVLPNYNKTRIKIGHQHVRWMELKEALRVQTHAVNISAITHVYCSSQIGTCILNDVGRLAAHKKQ